MNKTALLLVGLWILFPTLQNPSPPAPSAAAGEVLYREGDAVKQPSNEPQKEPAEIAQAPDVPVDITELSQEASAPKSKSADLHKFADAVEAITKQADEPELAPEWVQSVYEVRVTGTSTDPATWGQRATGGGTAVAVGPAKLHTAKHLTERLNGYTVEVQVSGEWRRATLSPVPGKDLAVLELLGTAALPAVKVRPPVYGERVTVYGLKTKSFAQGIYIGDQNPAIGDGLIPLDKGQTAVEQGDSGGGAFGDDGHLLGTISGRRDAVHEVTSIVPIVADAPKAPAAAQSAQVSTQSTQAVQSCPGGICPRPAYTQPSTRRGRRH